MAIYVYTSPGARTGGMYYSWVFAREVRGLAKDSMGVNVAIFIHFGPERTIHIYGGLKESARSTALLSVY